MHDPANALLDTDAAARRLNVSPSTLTKWRLSGEGPTFVKVGRHSVRYSPEALADFIAAGARRSTSDAAA